MITIKEAEEILKKEYHIDNFEYIVGEILLPDYLNDKHEVSYSNSIFSAVTFLGESKSCDVAIFEVYVNEDYQNRRVAITQEMFKILRGLHINNALVSFVNADKNHYRISLLTSKYVFDGNKIVRIISNPRRYSYSLGFGTKTKTAYDFLIKKGKVNSLDELINRFSVEVVNKQFYTEVATAFTELVGGERNGKTYEKVLNLQSVVEHNKYAEFGVRLIGRIMFCWFLREKRSENGISLVPDDILSLETIENSSNYYHQVLEPLFFELLNTNQKRRKKEFLTDHYNQVPYLNGGLFSPHTDDMYRYDPVNHCGVYGVVTIPNDWFIRFYKVLYEYNFTVDENTAYDIELSIDPEMLGRIFENLLAEINPETGENAKKSTGSFYTPRDIVDFMVDNTLCEYLKNTTGINEVKLRALISYGKEDDDLAVFDITEKKKIINALYTITALDPACGSGAFPIGILQKIVYILQELDPEANLWFDKATENVSIFIKKEFEKKFNSGSLNYIRKLSVIQNSIFGIDIQPIAVEISRLRCFLSLIIEEKVNDYEDNRGINPLPNLDFKFIIANSLIKLDDGVQLSLFENQQHIDELKIIREEYFNADSERRAELKLEFANIQQDMLINTIYNFDKTATQRYAQLSSWKPFANESTNWFDSDWMFGVKNGFDIVIANPPYIQLQKAISEDGKKLGDLYCTLDYETFTKTGDIYCLFYELGYNMLKPNGILTYITSNKWMKAAYGKNLRNLFVKKTNPMLLIDFAGQKIFDNATVDVNIIMFSKQKNNGKTTTCLAETGCLNNLSDFVRQKSIAINFCSNNNWIILSPIEQEINRKINTYGTPLKEWNIKINFGIKTGFNDAFIIDSKIKDRLVLQDSKSAELIRPILRGRDISRYGYLFADKWLICTFPSREYNIDDYPAVKEYLLSFTKEKLEQSGKTYNINGTIIKSRKKTTNKWFETQDSISYWDEFSKQKIVWARLSRISKNDFSDFPRFSLVPEDYVTLDSLCFFTGRHLDVLIHLLNSKFAAYYFFNNVAILDNGGMQMRQQFVENIPLPQSLINIDYLSIASIDKIIFDAFGFNDTEINFISDYLENKKAEISQK